MIGTTLASFYFITCFFVVVRVHIEVVMIFLFLFWLSPRRASEDSDVVRTVQLDGKAPRAESRK